MSIRQLAQSIVAATAMLAMPLAMAETNRINMAKGVTEVGAQIYDLHMLIFLDLRGYRCRCFRSDALFDLLPP